MSDKVMCILKFAEMLANVGKFVGLLAVSGLTALAVFLRYYHNKRTGVKSVAVDTEVIYLHSNCTSNISKQMSLLLHYETI